MKKFLIFLQAFVFISCFSVDWDHVQYDYYDYCQIPASSIGISFSCDEYFEDILTGDTLRNGCWRDCMACLSDSVEVTCYAKYNSKGVKKQLLYINMGLGKQHPPYMHTRSDLYRNGEQIGFDSRFYGKVRYEDDGEKWRPLRCIETYYPFTLRYNIKKKFKKTDVLCLEDASFIEGYVMRVTIKYDSLSILQRDEN